MGHVRFLIFYLACGVAAGLFHSYMQPDSDAALVGASGAISGVVAAYLIAHPRVRVWVLALNVIPLRISAATVLGIWVIFQIVMVLLPDGSETAWLAHVGGLGAGAVLAPFLLRKDVPLFGG